MDLSKYLILNKYFLNLFGFERIQDFLNSFKEIPEGFHSGGNSHFLDKILQLENLKLSPEKVIRYDLAIKEYFEKLGKNRRENINLKYFQYFAILFTEIFLDGYFNSRKQFLSELNSFVDVLNNEAITEKQKFDNFTEKDLTKLAYWMATGSGKTLIMHINYWQFLKYCSEKLDNIILVTPNEGLSLQHSKEMRKSGIPCSVYLESQNSISLYKNEVLIIDIHKLTKEKKGEGVRVEVDYFQGKNLVFIDEGHKGAGTEEKTWKNLREKLAEKGFIFEYSATFGQVIVPQDKDLLNEYSKAIIFDYSYKYFYTDGYGKDFYVYNLSKSSFQKRFRDLILTGNLLSFYEQLLIYEKYKKDLVEYNIEKPLWAFIGSKVIGKKNKKLSGDEERTASDVLDVVFFLKSVIENKKLLEENIEKILTGKSGLEKDGNDIFKDRFKEIRQNGYNIDDIYEKVFNTKSGTLSLYEIKSAEGEIGLKVGDGDYFGVINIGDVSGLKNLLTKNGIEVKTDAITPSLFEKINESGSSINILIGAKKFIEGWDSWRVCSMCLINMGKGEGPQIIQLFGRGVRLKGKNFSLKRTEGQEYKIKALETLNIFGLNADYMNTFLEAIRKEEVEYEEITIPIKLMDEKEKWDKLYILHKPDDFDFTNQFMELEIDDDILNKVKIDIRPRVKIAHGLETGEAEAAENRIFLDDKYVNLLNWDNIYLEILNYKNKMGYVNLNIRKEILPTIVSCNSYQLYAFPDQIMVNSFSDLNNLQEIVLIILKTYIDQFYNFKKRYAIGKELKPVYLVKEHENFRNYTIKIPKDKKEEIKEIKKLLEQIDKLYQDDFEKFPRIHFSRHLYTPLLIYKKSKEYIKSIPAQLNESETEFIKLLRDYLTKNYKKFKNEEIFLLRNLSKRGVEFFQTRGYFPDFIMWRRKGNKQTIIFIDPKGIRHLEDEKVQLYKDIKEIEKNIGKNGIRLESFIISATKFQELKKTYSYAQKKKNNLEQDHVLFMEDKEKLIEKLLEKSII